jgi:hypothetical protein
LNWFGCRREIAGLGRRALTVVRSTSLWRRPSGALTWFKDKPRPAPDDHPQQAGIVRRPAPARVAAIVEEAP